MVKIMLTVKIDEELKPVLEELAEKESRSQGGQIEYWIKKDAKKHKIPIVKKKK